MIKLILKEQNVWMWDDPTGSGWDPLLGCCEGNYEIVISVKRSHCQLLKY
jgi:hypothetical protein